MQRTTGIGHDGDPAVNGDLLVPAGLSWPDHSAQGVLASDANQTRVQSAHQTHQISRQLRDREPTEQIRSRATAPNNLHHPTDEHDTPPLLPLATARPSRHTHLQPVALGVTPC